MFNSSSKWFDTSLKFKSCWSRPTSRIPDPGTCIRLSSEYFQSCKPDHGYQALKPGLMYFVAISFLGLREDHLALISRLSDSKSLGFSVWKSQLWVSYERRVFLMTCTLRKSATSLFSGGFWMPWPCSWLWAHRGCVLLKEGIEGFL